MKRIVFIGIFLMIITIRGFSQIEKNTILIGGYANFTSTKNNSVFNLNPNTGLFLTDRFCLGISQPLIYMSGDLYWG